MDLATLLQTTPATLAKVQHDALKEHVLKILKGVSDAIKDAEYHNVQRYVFYSPAGDGNGHMFYSPAGDGNGVDSHCIDFSYCGKTPLDIMEVTAQLQALKDTANPPAKSPSE